MEVIIAHPNGWGVREQTFLREAAVKAGFSSADKAASRIRFVSEAEASVHFCIYHTLANLGARLQPGTNFAVCDAGGSTVDTTLYSVASSRPILKLEEKRASACVQAGAIFVDSALVAYLNEALSRAGLSQADVEHYSKMGVKDFEAFAKKAFSDESRDYSITIADSRFSNPAIRARRGRITLTGSTIKSCFNTCLQGILSSVDAQVKDASVSYILLVGGFGDSLYLRTEFKKRYEPQGSQIALTNDSSSKAVADGAVIWHCLSSVVSRAPRYSFGISIRVLYSPIVQDHRERTRHTLEDGNEWVYGAWSPIVTKGIPIDVHAVSRRPFERWYSTSMPDLCDFEVPLVAYAESNESSWVQDKQGVLLSGFQNICRITANLSNLSGALNHRTSSLGRSYWYLEFEVCIRFGGTELEAYLEWKERGVTRTGPMSIIPGDPIGV
ncbi:hypothetical protein FRC11_003854 [Ceratobasidium sp. 423]|nr:hypothetical protein FRC11_003854 [Ceratobasidium sp. 423]